MKISTEDRWMILATRMFERWIQGSDLYDRKRFMRMLYEARVP